MNDQKPVKSPAKTLTEFCELDEAALNRYLEQKSEFLHKLDQKADARILEALEKKLAWVA